MTSRPLYRLAGDERGHVPFAVICVVVLVSSLLIVGYLGTRDSASVEDDADLAMDRTDAAIQTAVRDAATRAAERAAQQPLTSVANTTYGNALDSDAPFESYLKALVYIEARQRLDATGQTVGSAETSVSLPAIENATTFENAIERVTLSAETNPTGNDTAEPAAVLQVELSGITTTLRADGMETHQRTESVRVAIATPIMQLHDRMELFQEKLDAGITEDGLSQRFNARIYALGWARGYAQYGGMPITEVIANRHVEPSVNDGVYRTQRDVFGMADPQLNDAIRRGWLCMAVRDAQELYEGYSRGSLDPRIVDGFCEASKWVFGDPMTGELPAAPETSELLGDAPGMDANHTIGVNETAYHPLGEMAATDHNHSFGSVIDRLFTFDVNIRSTYDRGELDAEVDCRYGYKSTDRTNEGVKFVISGFEQLDADEKYYELSGWVTVNIELTKQCWASQEREETKARSDQGSFTVDIETVFEEGEANPNANIDDVNEGVGIEYKYDAGPQDGESGGPGQRDAPVPGNGSFRNYEGAATPIVTEILGGTDPERVRLWVETRVDNATYPDEVVLPEEETVTLDHTEFLDTELERTLAADITAIQETVSEVNHTFERRELLDRGRAEDVGPFGRLHEKVNRTKMAFLERDDDYESVGQKVVYEARHAYFAELGGKLQGLEAAHSQAMGALDDELAGIDGGLDSAVSALQQGVSAEEPDPVPIESGDLTTNLTYEVSGAPTYFVDENVTKADLPQVEEGVTFSPLSMKNENNLRMPYQSIVDGLLSKVIDAIGLGSPDAEISFRMAGDALRAGELAQTAEAHTDEEYADEQRLARLTDELERETAAEIDAFQTRVAEYIAMSLYPDDVHIYCPTCYGDDYEPEVPRDCGTKWSCLIRPNTTAARAVENIEAAVSRALAGYETTAETAIAIGDGNATDPIIDEVVAALDTDGFRASYADRMADDQWSTVIDSAARPAVVTAASEGTVTLDSSDVVETLDNETRKALGNVGESILADRLEEFPDGEFEITDDNYGRWVDGTDTPIRVPAGVPLLPVPGYWFATMNVWDVEADGEYARFEATANMGTPDTTTATTYVRENRSVQLEIAGEKRTLGRVDPIDFSARSILVVVVPSGGVGVGDRDDEDPECSPTWPVVGQLDAGEIHCDGLSGTGDGCEDGRCPNDRKFVRPRGATVPPGT